MLDVTEFYKRNENIIIKKLGGKQWALNMETGSECTINNVAYDILNILSTPHTMDEIVFEIINFYDVSRETFIEDCKAWMRIALEKGLVEEAFPNLD
jgi:ubiquitin-protein ligase